MIYPGADSRGEREEMNKLERINEKLKEIAEIIAEKEKATGVELGSLSPGDRFDTEIGKFIVLGHENGVTKVIRYSSL